METAVEVKTAEVRQKKITQIMKYVRSEEKEERDHQPS